MSQTVTDEQLLSLRQSSRRDRKGVLPLKSYAALGDGRSVALVGADGSIDWWCVPHTDSPPLFDRLLNAEDGASFCIRPQGVFFVAERKYRENSNVLETVFETAGGRVCLTESLNSGPAGRLPWAELARRLEGLEGEITFDLWISFSRRSGTVNPYMQPTGKYEVFHAESVLGLFLHDEQVQISQKDDLGIRGTVTVRAGERAVMGIVAGQDEPLVVPTSKEMDDRIDRSDGGWKQWAHDLSYEGDFQPLLLRSALSLKFLIHSPSGAIAAAATTSLPEKIGGKKNYDYRYAWVRDGAYTVKALLHVNGKGEAHAAFRWLLHRLDEHGACVCYQLNGERVPPVEEVDLPGYAGSQPVVTGNLATSQHQHGVYGDIFGTAYVFVQSGGLIDPHNAQVLNRLADECANRWRRPDSGIWELETPQHFTMSKISCWEALARAVELADMGYLPTISRERWARERDRIAAWINENSWCEKRKAYLFYPGSDQLDASLALAVRLRFDGQDRLRSTLEAIDRELGSGAFHYRYSGAEKEEGCFLACTFWMVEAHALLGNIAHARAALEAAVQGLEPSVGVYAEMIDPRDGAFLGNMPQGLTHLAVVQAVTALAGGH